MAKRKLKTFGLFHKEIVKVGYMGNVTELLYMKNRNNKCRILKLNKNFYIRVDDPNGEVFEVKHIENRAQDETTIKQTMRNLRNIINTNVIDVECCRWVTLTYAENMTDQSKLQVDLKHCMKRLRDIFGNFDYISVREPQGRGAWHFHIIFIFDKKAPFIDNEILSDCWKKGFVRIKKLENLDNVGAYLTAYLCDVEYDEAVNLGILKKHFYEVKTVILDGKEKKFIKGARLHMYPPGMNLYSCSKGIKKPVFEFMSEGKAQKKVSSAKLTFESAIEIKDKNFDSIVYKRYYNSNLIKCQE